MHEAVAWNQWSRERRTSPSRCAICYADELLRLCLELGPLPPAATPLRRLLNMDPGSSTPSAAAEAAKAAAATDASKGRGTNGLGEAEPAVFNSTVKPLDATPSISISVAAASDDDDKGDRIRLWLQSSLKLD